MEIVNVCELRQFSNQINHGKMLWQCSMEQHLEQSFSSLQSVDVRIILSMAQSVRKAPQGAPPLMANDVFHYYIIWFEVVIGA